MKRTFEIEDSRAPEVSKLMLATVNALKDIGGSANLQELDERVVELEGVSEAEQQITMPNDQRPKLNYFLAWARTYLKRGGAVQNSSRGVWALTEAGELVESLDHCETIYQQVQAEERERQKQKRAKIQENKKRKDEPPLLELSQTDEDGVGRGWKEELLQTLGLVSPSGFERLSQRLLREAGFIKVEVRGKTADGGVDGIGVLRVNLVSFQVYFQCKRWKGSVGSKEIRDFRGALQGRADKGLFITTGTFTSQASEEATRDGAIAIDLIDGDRLCDLLKQFGLGVSIKMVEEVTVHPTFFQDY
ncbi:MAG: restriction endonuclease [Pseudomonadota bacterium]